jgi:hypothetical protein
LHSSALVGIGRYDSNLLGELVGCLSQRLVLKHGNIHLWVGRDPHGKRPAVRRGDDPALVALLEMPAGGNYRRFEFSPAIPWDCVRIENRDRHESRFSHCGAPVERRCWVCPTSAPPAGSPAPGRGPAMRRHSCANPVRIPSASGNGVKINFSGTASGRSQ